ncbi:MAG: putative CRISPR-associated protein [Deltaproteobacteria bacterium]|nr:putative CRISPR-associated protein [Deltaproteobacteria bacterium]
MTDGAECQPTNPQAFTPADRPRFYLVSVGTSLVTNYNKNEQACLDLQGIKYIEKRPPFANHETAIKDRSNFPEYTRRWNEINNWIKAITDKNKISGISAEMSSLLREERRFRPDDQVLLVATNTPEGHLCAYALKEVLCSACNKVGFGCPHVEIKCDLDGLGAADSLGFATRGLPNFIDFVQGQIEEKKKDGFEVILIPTGGYKALIPYMVIAGVLEEVPIRYVYEESPTMLELPPLPLHVDLPAWMQIESILDLLNKADMKECKNPIFQNFRKRVSGLMAEDATGKLVPTGLGKVFHARARKAAKAEVVLRAEHSPFLDFLSPCPELRDMFLKLAGIGHLIWKGDRVPEMADHGLRHHNDLFSLAERLLLPLFFYNDSFLSPQELYTLLCALFLHDCGHVVGRLDLNGAPKHLLPTHVRDYHHVLGYLRLKFPDENGKTGRILHNTLMPTGYDSNRLWGDYLAAPATVGLYHRKKMPLGKGGEPYPFFGQDKNYPLPFYLRPLEEHLKESPITVLGNPIAFERASLLVCLLRVIDGLDEQSGRTGGPDDVAFHLALLDTEVNELATHSGANRPVVSE